MRYTKEFLNTVIKKDVQKISDLLLGAFVWDGTPQRAMYWNKVIDNLQEIIAEKEKTEKKKKKVRT